MTAARFPTFLCRNREEVTNALKAIREHAGISQNELDDIAGFHVGYTGKLERPFISGMPAKQKSGRCAINPMFDLWLGALRVGVVLVPLSDADHETTTSTAPPPSRARVNQQVADKIRAYHAAGTSSWNLARMYGIDRAEVIDILLRRTHTIKVHDAQRMARIAS